MSAVEKSPTPPSPRAARDRGTRAAALAALAVWFLATLACLGEYRLVEPDEGRNASAAREVAASGDWTLPHFVGLPLLDKPPLWFDLAALAMRATGPSETAARLPSLLATALTVVLTGAFAARLFGREAAAPAALALASTPLVAAYAGIAIFDATLALLVTASLVAGWVAVEEGQDGPGSRRRSRLAAFLLWLAVLLGVLTKGPVAVALPLLVLVPYGLWRRRARRLWSLPGCALLVAVLVPWLASLEARLPGYLRYVLFTETLGRMTSDDLDRAAPPWYYVPYLLGGAAPWSIAALAAWGRRAEWREPRRDSRVVFLLLWLLVPAIFFTLTESKRPHYLLPLLPAIALLLAARWREPEAGGRARAAASAVLLALGAILSTAATVGVAVSRRLEPELVAPSRTTGLALAAACLVAGLLAASWRRDPDRALLGLAVPLLLLPPLSLPLLRPLAAERSSHALAELLAARCPQAPVVGIETLPPSLPFYLGRGVGLASASGRPFPSTWVERHWRQLAGEDGELAAIAGRAALTTARWPSMPPRAVVLARRGDHAAEVAAASHGFERLGEDHRRIVFGRGCPGRAGRAAE